MRQEKTLKGARTCAIIFISVLSVLIVALTIQPAVSGAVAPCLVCQGSESLNAWSQSHSSVNLTLDVSEHMEGNASLRATIENETLAVGAVYAFETALDLNQSFISLWVRVQKLGMVKSLYLQVGDSNGNWRQYDDFGSWFSLESGRWTRVVIDISHFIYQVPGFNVRSVAKLWFGSYDEGKEFAQTYWLDDIRLQTSFVSSPRSSSSVDPLPIWMVALNIVLTYLVAYPFGALSLGYLGIRNSRSILGGVGSLPIKLSVGIAVEGILFLAASLIRIDVFVVWGLWILALSMMIIINRHRVPRIRDLRFKSMDSVVHRLGVLLSLAFSVYLLSTISSRLGWAPPHDSIEHSMVVSVILSNNRLISSYLPISSLPLNVWGYSRGFYGLPVVLSLMSGLYPGQSTMLIGASFVGLLPSLLYSVTLIRTRSTVWATLSFLLGYLLPGLAMADWWVPSHDLVFAAFLVSTYPSIMGNLLLLTTFGIVVLFDDFGPMSFRSSKWLPVFLLLTVALGVSYYPYVVFPVAYLLVRGLIPVPPYALVDRLGRRKLIVTLIATLSIVSAAFVLARNYALTELSLSPERQYQVAQTVNPVTSGTQYYVYAGLVGLTIALGVYTKVRHGVLNSKTRGAELFFAIMLLIHFFALANETLYSSLLWMTIPSRSLIVLYSLSYIMIPVYLSHIHLDLSDRLRWLRPACGRSSLAKTALRLAAITLIVLAFSPMLSAAFNYTPSPLRQDILQVPRGDNYVSGQWIAANIDSRSLILNDLSLSGLSLTSFRSLHVVNDMRGLLELYTFGTLPENQETSLLGADRILQHPGDYEMVRGTMLRYNISYIYITNASRSLGLVGSQGRFAPAIDWKMTQLELLTLYLEDPYLQLVYQTGSAAVFKFRSGA